jgi:AcrR family transcriptional regulator
MTETVPADALARPTQRSQAKADRRAALLEAAAVMFAERGFNGVSIEDLGAAAGVSGPAVYRHFSSKQAVLGALLVGVSQNLLDGGNAVEQAAASPADALHGLIAFHVDFALAEADTIRVQDRDLDALAPEERREVRALQRRYIELWMRVQATFGLINSTPHSARGGGAAHTTDASVRPVLERMAWAALTSR